jgi:preprotein translocase subunit SecA
MRIFGSERLDEWLKRFGLKEGEAITHPWVTRSLEKAQQKVEARNFETRKHLLKYDDVMNDQRKVIYGRRHQALVEKDLRESCVDLFEDALGLILDRFIVEGTYPGEWDLDGLGAELKRVFAIDVPLQEWVQEAGVTRADIAKKTWDHVQEAYAGKEKAYGDEVMRMAERTAFLKFLDERWKEHLYALDHLRQGVHLRSYAQRDPLVEYKREAFDLFQAMLGGLSMQVAEFLFTFEADPQIAKDLLGQLIAEDDDIPEGFHPLPSSLLGGGGADVQASAPEGNASGTISRNAPCPCGSGKRYKSCHGKLVGTNV